MVQTSARVHRGKFGEHERCVSYSRRSLAQITILPWNVLTVTGKLVWFRLTKRKHSSLPLLPLTLATTSSSSLFFPLLIPHRYSVNFLFHFLCFLDDELVALALHKNGNNGSNLLSGFTV